jgi:hypothetical protein
VPLFYLHIVAENFIQYQNTGSILYSKSCFKFWIKDHLESIKCTLSGRGRIMQMHKKWHTHTLKGLLTTKKEVQHYLSR